MSDIAIRNIGTIVTGDIARPIADGDTIVARDGKIVYVGSDSADQMVGIHQMVDFGFVASWGRYRR